MNGLVTPTLGLAVATLLTACSGGVNVQYADQGVDEALLEPPSSLVAEDLQPDEYPSSSAVQDVLETECVPAHSRATIEPGQEVCKE